MSLTKRTATNILWRGSSVTLSTVLNFVVLAILANLLAPSDFGLRGIILIMMGFLILLADLGLGAALVHEPTITAEQFSTVFYLNVLLGFFLAAVLFASAGLIAAFFRDGRLMSILRVMSFAFLLSSFGAIFMSQLQKELRFKTRFMIDLAEWAVSGVASVALAFRGLGVWCIVYGYMLGMLVRVVLLWSTASTRPRLMFNLKSIDKFLKFGLFVYGEQLLNFLTRNLDNIIIGRYLGAEALGYYSLAYSLMLTPVSRISDSVFRVIFPAFSLIQHDDARIRAGYLKVVRYVAFVTFPMMAGMLVVAPQLIVAVYGPQWAPAVAVLQIFCLVGALQSVVSLAPVVQYTKGRSDISFKLNLLALACDAAAFFIGVRYGILGVAVAYVSIALILEPTIQIITNRLIGLSSKDFLRQFRLPTFGAFLIIVLVLAFKGSVGTTLHLSPAWLLIASVGLGLLAYVVLAVVKGRDLIHEAARMIGLKRDSSAPAGPKSRPYVHCEVTGAGNASHRLALVIATKDRPAELRRLMLSIRRQTCRPEQIIIVDGGAAPVGDVVGAFDDLNIVYRRSLPPSSSRQRNEGVELAGPDITLVGFLDDDCVLENDAIRAMMDFWTSAHDDVAGASFNMRNHPPSDFFRLKSLAVLKRGGIYSTHPGLVLPSGFQTTIGQVPHTICVRWLPSGAAVWRRDIFRETRFDVWFDGYGYLEDLDFSYEVGRRHRLVVVAEAGYVHLPCWDPRAGQFAFGRKEVRNRLHFVRKHSEFSRAKCYLTLGFRIMISVALAFQERRIGYLQRALGNISGLMGL